MQLALQEDLYILQKVRIIHDGSTPRASPPACLAKRAELPQRPLPTVVVAAPVSSEAKRCVPPQREGQVDKTHVLVAVAQFVVSELKHDLYIELSELLADAEQTAPHDDVYYGEEDGDEDEDEDEDDEDEFDDEDGLGHDHDDEDGFGHDHDDEDGFGHDHDDEHGFGHDHDDEDGFGHDHADEWHGGGVIGYEMFIHNHMYEGGDGEPLYEGGDY
jgi:hypothetical protein